MGDSEKNLKIRVLKVKDRELLSELIKKLAEKVQSDDILSFMIDDSQGEAGPVPDTELGSAGAETKKKAGEKARYLKIGIKLLTLMIDFLETDIKKWFASLVDIPFSEFPDLPFDAEMVILRQIVDAPEVESFFSNALQLYKKTGQYLPKSLTLKGE
jgi:hypothetical protein